MASNLVRALVDLMSVAGDATDEAALPERGSLLRSHATAILCSLTRTYLGADLKLHLAIKCLYIHDDDGNTGGVVGMSCLVSGTKSVDVATGTLILKRALLESKAVAD